MICAARSEAIEASADDVAGVAGVATVAGAPVTTGDGVAGMLVVEPDDCKGAAGGRGVEVVAVGVGVEGVFEEDAAAGVAFGCRL